MYQSAHLLEAFTISMTHSTVTPRRAVDATGRALPMTAQEIHDQAAEIARGLDVLDDMGDEVEQRQTLDALVKAIDEEPLSPRALPAMRLVFLDAGPLGLLTNPRGRPRSDQCRRWVKDVAAAGVRVFVPEIADYEVRRKLIHIQAVAGIRRLDQVKFTLDYAPITTDVMLRAADLWAGARSAGLPTAAANALDGDCILAAQALLSVGPSDTATVATDNVAHLARFVDAELWETITG